MPGCPLIPFLKPLPLSAVTEAPSVPCSSTILALPPVAFTSHRAARSPCRTKSEPIKVMYCLLIFALRLAVHEEDGHVRSRRGLQRRRPSLLLPRWDEQQVDALGDHVLDVGDLLGRRGLGVGYDELDPAGRGRALHGRGLRDPPGVVVLR